MDNDINQRKALYVDVMNMVVGLVDQVLDGRTGLTSEALSTMSSINERLSKDLDVPPLMIGDPMEYPD